jgi:hypothetical protein
MSVHTASVDTDDLYLLCVYQTPCFFPGFWDEALECYDVSRDLANHPAVSLFDGATEPVRHCVRDAVLMLEDMALWACMVGTCVRRGGCVRAR